MILLTKIFEIKSGQNIFYYTFFLLKIFVIYLMKNLGNFRKKLVKIYFGNLRYIFYGDFLNEKLRKLAKKRLAKITYKLYLLM